MGVYVLSRVSHLTRSPMSAAFSPGRGIWNQLDNGIRILLLNRQMCILCFLTQGVPILLRQEGKLLVPTITFVEG